MFYFANEVHVQNIAKNGISLTHFSARVVHSGTLLVVILVTSTCCTVIHKLSEVSREPASSNVGALLVTIAFNSNGIDHRITGINLSPLLRMSLFGND